MKNLATAYTYDPVAKTITLTGLNVPLSYLLLIVNATRGTIIYNLADPALAAAAYTQAANSVLTLNASVSTTFHDASDSLTIFYDDGIQTNTLLLQGPAGPKGDQGNPGTTTWAGITDKPATFAPSAHKASHATGGSDALTPADIGASVKYINRSQTSSTAYAVSSGRNTYLNFQAYSENTHIILPRIGIDGAEIGDVINLRALFYTTPRSLTIFEYGYSGSGYSATPQAIKAINKSNTLHSFILVQGPVENVVGRWESVSPPDHTHAIADTTGLQAALDGKAASSALAALEARVAALEAANP